MEHVTFLSGSWWWVKDYPKDPWLAGIDYSSRISKALEGKVEVAHEDWDYIKRNAFFASPSDYFGPVKYSVWQPTEGKVYKVDVEMEIETTEKRVWFLEHIMSRAWVIQNNTAGFAWTNIATEATQFKTSEEAQQYDDESSRNGKELNSYPTEHIFYGKIARIKPVNEPLVTCGQCGKELTLVRPGKYQCDNPECAQNKVKEPVKEEPDYGKEPTTPKEIEDREKLETLVMPLVRTGFELALLEIEKCVNELSYFRGIEIIKERIQELRSTKQRFDYSLFKKETESVKEKHKPYSIADLQRDAEISYQVESNNSRKPENKKDFINGFIAGSFHGTLLADRLQTEPTKHEGKEGWGFTIEDTSLSGEKGDTESCIMLSNGKWDFFATTKNLKDSDHAELQKIADSLNRE